MTHGETHELYINVCLTKSYTCMDEVIEKCKFGWSSWNLSIYIPLTIPGKWGISFHSYGHGHKMQCLPCTSAKAFASFPFPLALRMIPPGHTIHWRNIQGHDEKQRLTMVVSFYLLMQGNAQWTCTVLFPPSSHAHCQLYRSETCHNLLNTCKFN